MTVADLQGADFIGYDAPPAIVRQAGREGHGPGLRQPLLGPRRRRRSSDGRVAAGRRPRPHKVSPGAGARADRVGAVRGHDARAGLVPGRRSAVRRGPGADARRREGRRIAANFVNLVVRPEAPAAAGRAPGRPHGRRPVRARRLRPQAWSGPSRRPGGHGVGRGQGVVRVPPGAARGGRRGRA